MLCDILFDVTLRLAKKVFLLIVAILVLLILPGLPPYTEFQSYTVTKEMQMDPMGRWQPRFNLDKAVKLIDEKFIGSESIVLDGKFLYFGSSGGRILKLEDDENNGTKLSVVTKYGRDCENEQDTFCGPTSPLGIRLNSEGNIVFVDWRYGIFSVQPATGRILEQFVRKGDVINGKPPKLPNDLDIAKDGMMYWTDMSSEYDLTNNVIFEEKIGDSNGRLIQYDPQTKTNTELLTGLYGANGVQLSENEDFILVSECFKYRVFRYFLKGPKAGSSEIFLDGLPGMPDNIRPNGRGGFYIALFSTRCPLIDRLCRYPQTKKLLFRLSWLTLLPLKFLEVLGFQSAYLSEWIYYISTLGPLAIDFAARPTLIDVDANGNIIRILKTDKNKEMRQITQIIVGEKNSYLGSFSTSQIWKIPTAVLNVMPKHPPRWVKPPKK